MKHLGRGGLILATVIALFGAFAASASAVVFSNTGAITINDNASATPYPSNIAVSGLSGTVTDVNVTLAGFSHTFPDDVGVLLLAPNGASLLLQDGAGDDPDVSGVNTTFDDSASGFLPNATAWGSGSYKPTTYYSGDSFPSPGPGTAYNSPLSGATLASTFNGSAPNGTWSLLVRDFTGGDSGSISGGWRLELNNPPLPIIHNTPPAPLTQQPAGLPKCAGKSVTKIGTPGADTIVGTSGADVIAGLGGNDKLKGLGGNDKLCGGAGDDNLKGGGGDDTLKGEGGADICKGGGSTDSASGCETKKSIP
jgi:Ca2+-binding RTX toxin-like protein